MLKTFFGLLPVGCLLVSCAESPQTTSTSTSASVRVASVPNQPTNRRHAVWVDAPTGSHIGSGFVRTGAGLTSNDEPGLISAINSLNAAAASQRERPFAISAVSVVSGLSESQLLSQEKQTRLSLGELLAFNAIARNRAPKVLELSALKSQGKSWTDIAQANSVSIASVAQVARRASDLTAESYMKGLDQPGAPNIIRGLGVAPQGRPQGSGPVGP